MILTLDQRTSEGVGKQESRKAVPCSDELDV
jgi:hypothetical protein